MRHSTFRDPGVPAIVNPSSLSDRAAYRLMISAFVPRPIAFVSTRSPAGVDNCAPFSFSMGVSSHPMVLAVSIGERDGRPKDTARNILDTREFVVNLVTEAIAEKMNRASGDYAGTVSEFDEELAHDFQHASAQGRAIDLCCGCGHRFSAGNLRSSA